MNTFTIEDCIEMLAGYSAMGGDFELRPEDVTIVKSIARQAMRGTALTDRQLALMQHKLGTYDDQFKSAGVNVYDSLDNLRQPLRTIDRAKVVRVVDKDTEDAQVRAPGNFIQVKFPFNKSDAADFKELIRMINGYRDHSNSENSHYCNFTEQNVEILLDFYTNKPSFDIDEKLLTIYKKIKKVREKKDDVVSSISKNGIQNANSRALEVAEAELGKLSSENFIKYVDRKMRYGIAEVNVVEPTSVTDLTLVEKIAYRRGCVYSSKLTEETVPELLTALLELDRFPLLVLLQRNREAEQLEEITNFFAGKIPNKQQSVLFRTDGNKPDFNTLVHDRKLNNWVDENTQVVYLSTSLPKPLVKSGWAPIAALEHTGCVFDSKLGAFISRNCDLLVYREEHESLFRKHSKRHALM